MGGRMASFYSVSIFDLERKRKGSAFEEAFLPFQVFWTSLALETIAGEKKGDSLFFAEVYSSLKRGLVPKKMFEQYMRRARRIFKSSIEEDVLLFFLPEGELEYPRVPREDALEVNFLFPVLSPFCVKGKAERATRSAVRMLFDLAADESIFVRLSAFSFFFRDFVFVRVDGEKLLNLLLEEPEKARELWDNTFGLFLLKQQGFVLGYQDFLLNFFHVVPFYPREALTSFLFGAGVVAGFPGVEADPSGHRDKGITFGVLPESSFWGSFGLPQVRYYLPTRLNHRSIFLGILEGMFVLEEGKGGKEGEKK